MVLKHDFPSPYLAYSYSFIIPYILPWTVSTPLPNPIIYKQQSSHCQQTHLKEIFWQMSLGKLASINHTLANSSGHILTMLISLTKSTTTMHPISRGLGVTSFVVLEAHDLGISGWGLRLPHDLHHDLGFQDVFCNNWGWCIWTNLVCRSEYHPNNPISPSIQWRHFEDPKTPLWMVLGHNMWVTFNSRPIFYHYPLVN